MIVGGGGRPARNFTRHVVHRPRPPQVAVMSTPAACAALRIVVPGATVTVRADAALDAGRAAEADLMAGKAVGPLHGVPWAPKDLYSTKGIRTTGGSKILADSVPSDDATVVARLARAGAILLGKLNMHEFAYGPEGVNAHYGDTRNPWSAEAHRIAGRSSSGSGVAVAAGLAPGSLGSDTGGSIRIPASLCGLPGLQPTYGRATPAGA